MTVLQDMAAWLQAQGIDVTHGVTVFSGRLPNTTQDKAVALMLYGSRAPVFVMDAIDPSLPRAETPLVQMLVRHVDYDDGLTVAMACYRALLRLVHVSFQGTQFICVTPLQSPFFVGDTQAGETLFSCNFEVEVTPT